MFKIESYITPIILSYVDKYIKNFRLEDSQVSLWGGDASFHNLDLRLEVLEQELQLPVSFVSGHIRELLIHVPWTKLASEPITITINTIECILKLSGSDRSTVSDSSGHGKDKHKRAQRQDVEAPSGYVASLINKIVGNIRIYCNNLILKYVEEDIVLSMNVKHFKFESANENWEPAFIELATDEVTVRKLICINDLTICLDKRNAAGKIEIYQEPMLYKCSMTMHLYRNYNSATASRSSVTRLDVYCGSLEFGMSEQQLPMLIRLILLLLALKKKKLDRENEDAASSHSNELKEIYERGESWTSWAWSYVPAVLTASSTGEDLTNQSLARKDGHILQVGFYVDRASVIFKVVESNRDRSFSYQKKMRYMPILALELQGIYCENIAFGHLWNNMSFGISEVFLSPLGHCCCAFLETAEGCKPNPYLQIGTQSSTHKINSLFDVDAIENKGGNKYYNTCWDFHLLTYPDSVLLERTPAFVFDSIHEIALPDDYNNENLLEFGGNYEYSNLREREYMRVFVAPLKLRISSGFYHRMSCFAVAATTYEYSSYYTTTIDPELKDLQPPSAEDFDALTEYIPMSSMKVTVFSPVIEVELGDHPHFVPKKGKMYKRHKKISGHNVSQQQPESNGPKITIECQCLDVLTEAPCYVNRLVQLTCQLPDPPKQLFESCYKNLQVKAIGLTGRLLITKCSTTILVPFNFSYATRNMFKPQYWTNPDVPHSEITAESENLTVNGTKAKFLVMYEIICRLLQIDMDENIIHNSSLLSDAANDEGFPYMEFYIEAIRFKRVITSATCSLDMSLGSVKAFIFETNDSNKSTANAQKNIQQILFLSGPEPKKGVSNLVTEEPPLFISTLQYPLNPDNQVHPTILTYYLQEIRLCIDPLLCKWLLYTPKIHYRVDLFTNFLDSTYKLKSTESSVIFETNMSKRKSSQMGSIHSSSDKDRMSAKKLKIIKEPNLDVQEKIYTFLRDWFDVWKSMVFCGDISQCTIYFPMVSLSAVGSQGIQEALDEAIRKKNPPDIMVITLPYATNYCAQKQNLSKYLLQLPVKLPESLWSKDRSNFPWTISVNDLSCYTIQNGQKIEFLKPVSLSATIGLSTKSSGVPENVSSISSGTVLSPKAKNNIIGIGVCVHVDTTPVLISTSEVQVYLFASIIYGLTEVLSNLMPEISAAPVRLPESSNPESRSVSGLFLTDSFEASSHNVSSMAVVPQTEPHEPEQKLTAWLQWTITKCTIELNSASNCSKEKKVRPKLKLVCEMEDIVSSLDFQSVYLKIKSKIGSVSVKHFKCVKDQWLPGPYTGIVMTHRDDIINENRHEDNAFINITITRASCQHTHTLWGTSNTRKSDFKMNISKFLSPSKFITEIVVSIKPTDFIVSFKTLRTFYLVLEPLIEIPASKRDPVSPSTSYTGDYLPLAYLDCHDIRVIMPVSKKRAHHDVYIFQIGKISLNPTAVNPICRTPYRPDIYQHAARNGVLNIPGSDLEDRQYQLDIFGISLSTGTWKNVEESLSEPLTLLANLHSRSENPALEWNNLDKGQVNSINAGLNLQQVVEKFDVTVLAAPAMYYKNSTLICCNSVEINITSDIFISLSLNQIKLALSLFGEVIELMEPIAMKTSKTKIKFPYSRYVANENSEPYKDSGIESSDFKSIDSLPRKQEVEMVESATRSVPTKQKITSPIEFLFTGGKISFSLYAHGKTYPSSWNKPESEPAESLDLDTVSPKHSDPSIDCDSFVPFFFVSFSQPNVYFSEQINLRKLHFCIFNLLLKMSGPEYCPVRSVPREKDYPIPLIETLPGVPHPNTGIPPAFLTIKFVDTFPHELALDLDFGRPTKFSFSTDCLLNILSVKREVLNCLKMENIKVAPPKRKPAGAPIVQDGLESYIKYKEIKELLFNIHTLNIRTNQLLLVMKSQFDYKICFTIGQIKNTLTFMNKPDKICNYLSFDCVSLLYERNYVPQLILNPWSSSLDCCLFWETWQFLGDDPQVQLTLETDCLSLTFCPERIKIVSSVVEDFCELIDRIKFDEPVAEEMDNTGKTFVARNSVLDVEQHYKDDLRAGAFQFVDSTTNNFDEMPLPYQVMFWTKGMVSMSWRYPQPRCLTKIRVFPVPLKLNHEDPFEITCSVEHWSECHGTYAVYTTFQLPQNEILHLDLPPGNPHPPFAAIWRVVVNLNDVPDEADVKSIISSRILAACMRIDSYFNKTFIPKVSAALIMSRVNVNFQSSIDKERCKILPKSLNGYSSDMIFPTNHCFLTVCMDNTRLHFAAWGLQKYLVDLNTTFSSNVLDYSFLTMQPMIEPVPLRYEVSMANNLNSCFIAKSIAISFGPSIAHTLAVSTQLWNQNFSSEKTDLDFIVVTRFVICNNTNATLKFGQVDTDEEIVLVPKHFHLYSWRSQKKKQVIKVAVEYEEWLWSKPFSLVEGNRIVEISPKLTLNLSVDPLSATQLQVAFSGQLVIANMLIDNFELKIVQEKEKGRAINHVVTGNSMTSSMIVNFKKRHFLRLRFYGLDASWSGDIPLVEHTKSIQPWLVKVPLLEKGQFLSIWCRIVVQDTSTTKKTLAMLWPLFTIKSNLPIPVKVNMETPMLSYQGGTEIQGKGVLEQLYCPGTIDHSHQLKFQMENITPPSNSYVPLNYSLVDHEMFFTKLHNVAVDAIINELKHYNQSKWPYFDDDLDRIDWFVEEQPETHVQVKYQASCLYSSSLMIELLPWCLMVNLLGCSIGIKSKGQELCTLRHNGIIAPPKIEETFNVYVYLEDKRYISDFLQLEKLANWSPATFYMPKISGIIPIEGAMYTNVKCNNYVCRLSVQSTMKNDIRLLKVCSSHVLCNYTSFKLHVICLCLPNTGTRIDVPQLSYSKRIVIEPELDKENKGVSIVEWFNMDKQFDQNQSVEYTFYLMFSISPKLGWSCPVKVDDVFIRRSISVSTNQEPIPLAVTSYEYKGQLFVSAHVDSRPQIYIENLCGSTLYCAQALPEDDGSPYPESDSFNWFCKIRDGQSNYYSMASLDEKYPDIPTPTESRNEKIIFCLDPFGRDREWSPPVDLSDDIEQFLKIPAYGDVKVVVQNTSCLTFVTVESLSKVEISARDIRARLISLVTMNPVKTETVQVPISTSASAEILPPKITDYPIATDKMKPVSIAELALSKMEEPNVNVESDVALKRRWSDSNISIVPKMEKPGLAYTFPMMKDWKSLKILILVNEFSVTLLTDIDPATGEIFEMAQLTCDNITFSAVQSETMNLEITVQNIQLDNQIYSKKFYDFPVVLMPQKVVKCKKIKSLNVPISSLIKLAKNEAVIKVKLIIDSWINPSYQKVTGIKKFKIIVQPLSCYAEDAYLTDLLTYLVVFIPTNLVCISYPERESIRPESETHIHVSDLVIWQGSVQAHPLIMRSLFIDQISILLSVHSSVKLYVALDQSPLVFAPFERKRVYTNPYRLGHTLTMHYLSGAIFRAGWVVSSLEILGSPAGLARAMGSGLRDFVGMPFQGLFQGPVEFLWGVTHGSASLMKHLTAGTLQSVTKMAESVARNLDRLTLDEEHVRRVEEQRRQRPQGVTEGIRQGLTGLGISILGAIGGMAHHPLQSVITNGGNPRSLAAGLGLGIVGVITKPLSGAAELLALTGQGLLQGAGWNNLPEPRNHPVQHHMFSSNNALLKYEWKITMLTDSKLIHVTDATSTTSQYTAVALIITSKNLIIMNSDDDLVHKCIGLSELEPVKVNSDPTLLCFKLVPVQVPFVKDDDDLNVEMDPVSRARVADYVKNTIGLLELSNDVSREPSEMSISPLVSPGRIKDSDSESNAVLSFYVNPQDRNYFLCLLSLAKHENLNSYNYPVL